MKQLNEKYKSEELKKHGGWFDQLQKKNFTKRVEKLQEKYKSFDQSVLDQLYHSKYYLQEAENKQKGIEELDQKKKAREALKQRMDINQLYKSHYKPALSKKMMLESEKNLQNLKKNKSMADMRRKRGKEEEKVKRKYLNYGREEWKEDEDNEQLRLDRRKNYREFHNTYLKKKKRPAPIPPKIQRNYLHQIIRQEIESDPAGVFSSKLKEFKGEIANSRVFLGAEAEILAKDEDLKWKQRKMKFSVSGANSRQENINRKWEFDLEMMNAIQNKLGVAESRLGGEIGARIEDIETVNKKLPKKRVVKLGKQWKVLESEKKSKDKGRNSDDDNTGLGEDESENRGSEPVIA